MKNYIVSVLSVLALFLNSCTSEFDPGGTVVEKLAGNWWVFPAYDYEGDANDWEDYDAFTTYNTADNNGDMWVEFTLYNEVVDCALASDYVSIKFKVACDAGKKTFATPAGGAKNILSLEAYKLNEAGDDVVYDEDGNPVTEFLTDDTTYTISNGLVEIGAYTTAAGNISDKISFDVTLSNRPDLTVHVEGYRRTIFSEDDLW